MPLQVESDDQIRARCLFINQLRQHIEQCEHEENYIEADRCKKRLNELQTLDKRARIVRLKERHRAEVEQLESVMSSELEEREKAWKEKFEQFEIQAADQLNQLKQRQNDRRQAEE